MNCSKCAWWEPVWFFLHLSRNIQQCLIWIKHEMKESEIKSKLLAPCDICLNLNPKQNPSIIKSCQMSSSISAVPGRSFSHTFVYLHLAVDRWDSISSTEESHVNHKDSIILHTWRWFIISIDICHILMTKCVGPPVNLCSPLGHRSDGETVIMALPDTWISSPTGRSAISVPRAWGAAHCEIETRVSHWLG